MDFYKRKNKLKYSVTPDFSRWCCDFDLASTSYPGLFYSLVRPSIGESSGDVIVYYLLILYNFRLRTNNTVLVQNLRKFVQLTNR